MGSRGLWESKTPNESLCYDNFHGIERLVLRGCGARREISLSFGGQRFDQKYPFCRMNLSNSFWTTDLYCTDSAGGMCFGLGLGSNSITDHNVMPHYASRPGLSTVAHRPRRRGNLCANTIHSTAAKFIINYDPSSTVADVEKWTNDEWEAAKAKWSAGNAERGDCERQVSDQKLTDRQIWLFINKCVF
jgi:hypothetical protein